MDLLVGGLRRTVPEHLRVKRETTIVLTRQTAPEPDLVVLRGEVVTSRRQTRYEGKDAVLASPCPSRSTST